MDVFFEQENQKPSTDVEHDIAIFMRQLTDNNAAIARSAARKLGEKGKRAAAAIPLLIEAAQADDTVLRAWAVGALGRIREASLVVVPVIAVALRDEQALVRQHAAAALGFFGEEARPLAEELRRCLRDQDIVVRTFAESALTRLCVVPGTTPFDNGGRGKGPDFKRQEAA